MIYWVANSLISRIYRFLIHSIISLIWLWVNGWSKTEWWVIRSAKAFSSVVEKYWADSWSSPYVWSSWNHHLRISLGILKWIIAEWILGNSYDTRTLRTFFIFSSSIWILWFFDLSYLRIHIDDGEMKEFK
jgi:hypothetical protein